MIALDMPGIRRCEHPRHLSLQRIPREKHGAFRRISAHSLALPSNLEMAMPTRCCSELSIAALFVIPTSPTQKRRFSPSLTLKVLAVRTSGQASGSSEAICIYRIGAADVTWS